MTAVGEGGRCPAGVLAAWLLLMVSACTMAPAEPPPAPTATSRAPTPAARTPAGATPSVRAVTTPPAKDLIALQVQAECAGESPGRVDLYAELDRFRGRDLVGVLRGSSDIVSSISPEWDRDEKAYFFEPLTLTAGNYWLTVELAAESRVVAAAAFDVLGCVTATTACRTVTFRNPAGNPKVRVEFTNEDETDLQRGTGGAVTVQPGKSKAVETSFNEISWRAYGLGIAGDDRSSSAGGYYSELVDQDC